MSGKSPLVVSQVSGVKVVHDANTRALQILLFQGPMGLRGELGRMGEFGKPGPLVSNSLTSNRVQ